MPTVQVDRPIDAGRLAASLIPAAALTLCLFVVMDRLVTVGEINLSERTFRPLARIVPLIEETEVREERDELELIREVQPPPRHAPVRQPVAEGITLEIPDLNSPVAVLDPVSPGELFGSVRVIQDREQAIPIRDLRVEYPRRALSAGLEGECEVSFSVDAAGRPLNIAASCTNDIFARSSVQAVGRSLFVARVRDGVPVRQDNLVYPIQYRLED